jgi:hypothetical protein
MAPQTLEGTWEEITQHAAQLAGHRVRVTVLDPAAGSQYAPTDPEALEELKKAAAAFPPGTTLADLMKDYIGSVTSAQPHNDSERVDEIFGEIMEEKRRKWNQPK